MKIVEISFVEDFNRLITGNVFVWSLSVEFFLEVLGVVGLILLIFLFLSLHLKLFVKLVRGVEWSGVEWSFVFMSRKMLVIIKTPSYNIIRPLLSLYLYHASYPTNRILFLKKYQNRKMHSTSFLYEKHAFHIFYISYV